MATATRSSTAAAQATENLPPTPSSSTSDWNNDPKNPQNWTAFRKWTLTGFSCFLCFMVGINALSIASAAKEISAQFNISDANFPHSYWTVTAWNVGAMIGPVFGLPLMENLGVRIIYIVSYLLFVIFTIPQALAQNYATLIVTRFFSGIFGGIVQNAVANVIGDLFVGADNNLPSIFFIYAYLAGFTLGPTFGSAVVQFFNWRWIFYIQLIMYGVLVLPTWLLIKETRGAIIQSINLKDASVEKTKSEATPSFMTMLYEGTIRPLRLFFTEPVLFAFTIWASLAVSNVFLGTQSIARTYGASHGFGDIQAGYVEGSMVIGETIGLFFSIWQSHLYIRSAKNNTERPGMPIPEAQLTLSIPLSFFGIAGGLLIYAWTNYADITWVAPTIGLVLVGIGMQVVVTSAITYVTDCYGIYAGSAIAACAFVENLCSAFLPLSTFSMYSTLGFQWASSLLALFAVLLSFAPLVLYLKGPQIRARSKFMKTL